MRRRTRETHREREKELQQRGLTNLLLEITITIAARENGNFFRRLPPLFFAPRSLIFRSGCAHLLCTLLWAPVSFVADARADFFFCLCYFVIRCAAWKCDFGFSILIDSIIPVYVCVCWKIAADYDEESREYLAGDCLNVEVNKGTEVSLNCKICRRPIYSASWPSNKSDDSDACGDIRCQHILFNQYYTLTFIAARTQPSSAGIQIIPTRSYFIFKHTRAEIYTCQLTNDNLSWFIVPIYVYT